jgi:signal transduction histidine kinase
VETSVEAFELPDLLSRIVDVPKRAGVHRDILILGNAAEESVSAKVAEALIHVGVEALTNSERHSQANTQTIEASVTDREIVVKLVDNGRGSPILGLSVAQLTAMGHLGVASMHRRVETVGGCLSIESSVEGGTSVTIRAPRGSRHE